MKSLADVLAPALAVAASALVACHDGSAEFHAAVKVRLGVTVTYAGVVHDQSFVIDRSFPDSDALRDLNEPITFDVGAASTTTHLRGWCAFAPGDENLVIESADATLDATFNAATSRVEIDARVKCTFANGSEGSWTNGDG